MSLSTLDRWIASGQVQIKQEPHGQRPRVYVATPEDGPDDAKRELVDRLPGKGALAVARERVRGLEVVVEQLKAERDRYVGLMNDLKAGRGVVGRTER